MKNEIVVATHSGPFHADDVFAVATLKLVAKATGVKMKVLRTRDRGLLHTADFVVDVGGELDPPAGRFDHHQGVFYREDAKNFPYAAFGLVWKEFGEAICSSAAVAQAVDRRLVRHVDAVDNGIGGSGGYGLASVIKSFSPSWRKTNGAADLDMAAMDRSFFRAVAFAKTVLKNEIERAADIDAAATIVLRAANQSHSKIIVLKQFVPWKGFVSTHPGLVDFKFVVFPSIDGIGWYAQGIPVEPGSFESRSLFPLKWRGLSGSKLDEASGIPGGVFVHQGGFIGQHQTKVGVIEMAQRAILTSSNMELQF